MFDFLGGLISGGINYLTGSQNRDTQMQIAQQNIAQQRDFAQHGLGYRVEDAVAHGLSPLVGAGVQPATFNPVSVNSTDFGSMGQDIGRAVKALGDMQQRKELDLEQAKNAAARGHLENDILKTELVSRVRREEAASAPAMPPGWLSMVSGDRSPKRSASGFALEDDRMKQKEESAPTVRSLPIWGSPWKTYPHRASAQDIENEYGDEGPIPWLLNTGNFVQDALWNMGQSSPWQKFEAALRHNYWDNIRGGDRSRWSRAQRTLVGR